MRHERTPDDDALVGSCTDADRFVMVFEMRHREIWQYLAARLGRDEADELLSEVFLRAFAARSRFDPYRGSARSWLYGIANNVCRECLRRRPGNESPKSQSRSTEVPDFADGIAEWRTLHSALTSLSEDHRAVVLLVTVAGLSYEEASRVLKVPVGTVRSRLSRGLNQLRPVIDEYRRTTDAGSLP